MKIYHFAIIFSIIALSLVTISDIHVQEYMAVQEERTLIDRSFDRAVDAAITEFIRLEDETLLTKKENAAIAFFHAMQAALGSLDNEDAKRKLDMYVPVIAVVDDTGFYINYSKRITNVSGTVSYVKRWTERIPFSYEDGDFVYLLSLENLITIYDKGDFLLRNFGVNVIECSMYELLNSFEYEILRKSFPRSFLQSEEGFELFRKETIIKKIERYMNYYVNAHNEIAKEFGLTYQFLLPSTDDSDWIRSIEAKSMIVLFQGYPLRSGDENYYNRFSVAGTTLHKNELYFLEKMDWYYIYHNEDCPLLNTFASEIVCYSREECASYGAYACRTCSPNLGVYPP